MLVPKDVAVDLFAVFSFVKSAFVRSVTSAARLFVRTTSAAARITASLFKAVEFAVAAASTYDFTAFCVGYNVLLVPSAVDADLFDKSSLSKSALVRFETSNDKFVVNVLSAFIRLTTSVAKFVVSVLSALIRLVVSVAKLVVNTLSALVRFVTSFAKLVVKIWSALIRLAISVAKSLLITVVTFVVSTSTYVFTAFWVG